MKRVSNQTYYIHTYIRACVCAVRCGVDFFTFAWWEADRPGAQGRACTACLLGFIRAARARAFFVSSSRALV